LFYKREKIFIKVSSLIFRGERETETEENTQIEEGRPKIGLRVAKRRTTTKKKRK